MPLLDSLRSLRRNRVVGAAEYFLRPGLGDRLGGPFNGQARRREIYEDLVAAVGFDAVIECGTYRGSTTPFLQHTAGVDVDTVEADPRFYGFSRVRLSGSSRIRLHLSDSRAALRSFAARPDLAGRRVFVYLDAHWRDDLPLAEEVEILFGSPLSVVAMVDDFRVPGDDGYGYDAYGPDKTLDAAYLDRIPEQRFRRFYPEAPSSEETGRRRGSVVLAGAELADTVATCATLTEAPAATARRVA